MQPLALFGPLGVVDPYVEYVVLVLALANLATRKVAFDRYRRQAQDGVDADDIGRHMGHEATNVLLVLAAFYMMLVHYHGGFVMSMLALGLVVTDFFEFEARLVEARTEKPIEAPKGSLVASAMLVAYALFQALWFLVEGYWQAAVS